MWSAEPIGAVNSARAPNPTGQLQGWARDHPKGGGWPPHRPRHSPTATARAPSRYAVHRAAVTTADDKAMGRSPGAQPRGPRPGFAAEGPAAATSSSRANERASAAARSHPSDRSARANLISSSGSHWGTNPATVLQGPGPADGERKPDVAILPGAVELTSPVRAGNPMLQIAGHLQHSQPGSQYVDGQPNLNSPPARQR